VVPRSKRETSESDTISEVIMTKHDLEGYRRRLQEMARRLTGEVSDLQDEATRPTGEGASTSSTDPEVVHGEGEEEVALAVLGIEGNALGEIAAALARIDQGTFGDCTECRRKIARARLDALPYARRCIRCAERN
jgi:RNA polymerase-binding transcription factor DksA